MWHPFRAPSLIMATTIGLSSYLLRRTASLPLLGVNAITGASSRQCLPMFGSNVLLATSGCKMAASKSMSTSASTTATALSSTKQRVNGNDTPQSNGNIDLLLPSLVLIGDRDLMSPCEPCDITKLQNGSISDKLGMLKRCQKKYGGIGIASCQVGWRTRIFCMGIDDDDVAAKARYPNASDELAYQFWINPTIEPVTDKGTCWFWEGCLSVPGMRGWVERPRAISISGYNEHGQFVDKKELDGLAARVAQHEYDHLDGIMFPTRALTGTLLPVAAFRNSDDDSSLQDRWPTDWPTPGSRNTKPGSFSNFK